MLAVIVLVSMVAGVTFSNLAAVGADSDRRSAIAQLQSLDSRTRLMSQQGQQVILTTTRDRDGVVLRAASTSEVIGTIALPPGVRVHLQVQDEPVGAIRFDRLGRSLDYTIILEHETANRVIDVAGLTGLIREGGPPT
jgi:type II secretory pathway pseudopilin PulG